MSEKRVRPLAARKSPRWMASMTSPAPSEIMQAQASGSMPAAMASLPRGKLRPKAAPVINSKISGLFIKAEILNQVLGDQSAGWQMRRSIAMQPGCAAGGFKCGHALRQQATDKTG